MESQSAGKRQRRPPGQWWLSSSLGSEGAVVTERQPLIKKLEPSHTESKRKKADDSARLHEKEPVSKKSQARGKMPRQNKSGGQVRAKALQKKLVKANTEQVEEQQQEEVLDSDPLNSSPSLLPPRGDSGSSGENM